MKPIVVYWVAFVHLFEIDCFFGEISISNYQREYN